jgi:hypothetical protein
LYEKLRLFQRQGLDARLKKFISNLVIKLHNIDSDNITNQPEQINRQINSHNSAIPEMGLEASAVTLTNTYMEVVTTQKINFSEDPLQKHQF